MSVLGCERLPFCCSQGIVSACLWSVSSLSRAREQAVSDSLLWGEGPRYAVLQYELYTPAVVTRMSGMILLLRTDSLP